MEYEKIEITDNEYKKLSDREKLKVIRTKLNILFNSNNKKVTSVIYKGKRKNVDKDKIGLFKDLVQREKSLEKKVTERPLYTILLSSSEYKNMSFSEKKEVLLSKLNYIFDAKLMVKYKDEQLVAVIYQNTTKFVPRSLYEKANRLIELLAKLENEKNMVRAKKTREEMVYSYMNEDENSYDMGNAMFTSKVVNSVSSSINSDSTTNENTDNLGFALLPKNTKIAKKKNKKKIKDKIKGLFEASLFAGLVSKTVNVYKKCKDCVKNYIGKHKKAKSYNLTNRQNIRRRATATVCAFIIFLTGFMSFKGRNDKKDNNGRSIKTNTSQIDTGNINVSSDNINKDNIINKDNNNESVENDVILDNKVSFDDTVTINNNSYIYTNSYDATYGTNPYNPYFDSGYERDVQGIVYELDGNIFVIYESDSNALERQKQLESRGATVTAVLVTRTDFTSQNSYEGYYNVNNVKIKTR